MRIAAAHNENGKIFGLVEGEQFRPLLRDGNVLHDLRDVIVGVVHNVLTAAPAQPLAGVTLAAPVGPLPKNVMCVGKNYHDHAQEFARSGVDQSGDKQEVPEFPVIFTKAVTALANPGQGLPASADPTHTTDYEGELGVVIGKHVKNGRIVDVGKDGKVGESGKSIKSVEDAYDAVFGYTIVNDATARAVQQRHKQWFLGKSLDGYCPVGPYLVTADEFGRPDAQELATYVNGERRQFARLRDLIFDVPATIMAISEFVPLEPGDLIATGTPAGVGIGFSPPRYLKPGDEVRISITGIGELANPVV